MNVLVNGKQESLNIVDRNGIDFTIDFIGNHGALADGQFSFNEELNAYECDQDTYEWWAKVIADHQALEDRIAKLREVHGSDAVQAVLGQVGGYDLEDLAAAINRELDAAFPVK